ncbi:unnamed protein product [Rotaria sordida]|uniref:Uncharacterized protein n=1 Tax=Rotaria sordida TaxID=392033 RepID=A0A814DWU3_9BILA|nr:unnamed protein product [Rotaria sordida]
MMNNWNRSRDVSSEDQSDLSNKSISSSYKKRQQLSTLFNKTADIDDSLFSRHFFTLYQKLCQKMNYEMHLKFMVLHLLNMKKPQQLAHAMEKMNGTVITPHIRPLKAIISSTHREDYKPKFAEPFSSKHHCDNEDTLPTPASIYNAISPLYRQKISSTKQYLPLSTCSLSNIKSKINNERRLIVRCEMTITKYYISKLFDLIPNMEEYSPININIFNERKL